MADPPAGVRGRVHLFVLGPREAALSALRTEDGAHLWSVEADWSLKPENPAVSNGRVFLAADVAVAFDAEDGEELWRFVPDTTVSGWITATPDAAWIGTRSRAIESKSDAGGPEPQPVA